jgi:hypothetical protein
LFVTSRDFLLTHPFTGSTATSEAGSLGIGVNGMHSSGAVQWFVGATLLINISNNNKIIIQS